MNPMKMYLQKLAHSQLLTREEAYDALRLLGDPQTTLAQRGAFLAMLALRQETAHELAGFLTYLKQHTIDIPLSQDLLALSLIDLVGTGGDNLNTFNISTASSLVVASGGVNVAKHGGRSVSSLSGSADVLEALGITLLKQPEAIAESLSHHHYAFLFAPFFNPVLGELRLVRQELGLRTFLNILAPLANPLQIRRQVVGLSNTKLLSTVATALKESNSLHAMVVNSQDGMDELTLSSPCTIAHLQDDAIKIYTITAAEVGLPSCDLTELRGGDAQQNAQIIQRIFSGQDQGAKRNIILLNAAAGFIVADRVKNFAEGIALATQCIDNGATLHLLTQLQTHPS